MPRISVIVPARDVEGYLGVLLDDLRLQTFQDLEVIVVDDGSTDKTTQIIADIAEHDRRFRQLSSAGAGVSAARNLGVEHASGEFLAFVDADDRVSPDYLRILYESVAATGSDLVSCNANRLDGFHTSPSYLQQRACGSPRRCAHISRSPQLVWDTTVWNKLWRHTMWQAAGIRYADGRWINDIAPSIHGHVASGQVDTVSDVLYFWRVRTDPTTSITDRKLTDAPARLKSLNDRLFALRQARGLLTSASGATITAFDQRVLELDLPIYLPYYAEADEHYRDILVRNIKDLLEAFHIEPARFPLGMVLQEAYRGILSGDVERLGAALDPATRVAPSARLRQHTELRLRGRGPHPARTPHGLLRWGATRALRQVTKRGTVPAAVRAEATAVSMEIKPTGQLTISGAVRVREGRSYLPYGWQAAARLDGTAGMRHRLIRLLRGRLRELLRERLPTARRLTGPATPVAEPPDRALHPLVRSGWVPFTAAIDLAATRRHPDVDSWRLAVELRGGRMALAAPLSLPDEVTGSLPAGVRIDPAVDLVPGVSRTGELSFRVEPAGEGRAAEPPPPAEPNRLDLRWAAAGDAAGALEIGGSGTPAPGTTLALRCPWTRTTLSSPVEPAPDGWRALIDTTAMDRDQARQGQRWSISVVVGGSNGGTPAQAHRETVHVPSAYRSRFPLTASLRQGTAFLVLDRDYVPALTLAAPDPRVRLWPQLLRVERSA